MVTADLTGPEITEQEPVQSDISYIIKTGALTLLDLTWGNFLKRPDCLLKDLHSPVKSRGFSLQRPHHLPASGGTVNIFITGSRRSTLTESRGCQCQ